MAWIVVAVLVAVVALLISLYRRSMAETTHVTALLVLVLLDESVYRAQQVGLIDFAKTAPAGNAMQLSNQSHTALVNLAGKMAGTSVLGAHSFLWNIRNGTV